MPVFESFTSKDTICRPATLLTSSLQIDASGSCAQVLQTVLWKVVSHGNNNEFFSFKSIFCQN